jgi:uncharacterized protein YdeI (YjbR/CyaY-like superfamily)
MRPVFFETPDDFRAWLAEHHATAAEVLVGFYKKGSGRPSITWPESVDEALCFGWIDGIRRGIDEVSYTIRFTPRRAGSTWSAVNIKRAMELVELGRMRPAGLRAFQARTDERSAVYAYEQRHNDVTLGEEFERLFRTDEHAWAYFQQQPASYRRTVIWWVLSAKQEETKRNRLAKLIAASAAGRRL